MGHPTLALTIEQPEVDSELTEAIENASEVFVELGPHVTPVAGQGQRRFDEDHLYVGLDTDPQVIEMLGWALESKKFGEQNLLIRPINYQRNEVPTWPLPSGCADEVFYGNVFGEPGPDSLFTDPDGTTFADKALSLFEAARVLKPGGRLVVLETLSPEDCRDVLRVLSNYGFMITKHIKSEDDDWAAQVAPYHENAPRGDMFARDYYMIVAELAPMGSQEAKNLRAMRKKFGIRYKRSN